MLTITIPGFELYDESKNEFVNSKEHTIQLEHSLVSLSTWESKWCKPFLIKGEKTTEEMLDYIRCMTITKNVDQEVLKGLTEQNVKEIKDYIDAPMTATILPNRGPGERNRETQTAELLYFAMISLNIPFECQKWHLNRLITLINVCNIKNAPPKKMSAGEIARRNHDLNEQRKKALNSEG